MRDKARPGQRRLHRRRVEALQALADAGAEPDRESHARALLRALALATASEVGALWVFDDDRKGLELAALSGLTTAEPGRIEAERQLPAWAEGEPRTFALPGWRGPLGPTLAAAAVAHVAVLPLSARGQREGFALLARGAPYDALDLAQADALLGPVVAQLGRWRRDADEQRRRSQDLGRINELGRVIAEQLDLGAVLTAGVRHVALIAEAPQAFVLLLSPEDQRLRIVAATVDEQNALGLLIDEPSIAWAALRRRQPVQERDTSRPGSFSPQRVARFGQRALLAVPMISRNTPIGAVLLGHTDPSRSFSPAAVDRAQAVANQLATAIANARLFDSLRQSYRDLEQAQQRLVQRERLVALGELAASVAHEIRNPLGVLFNSISTLRKVAGPGPDTGLLLTIAEEEAQRLNRIVGELLDFARPTEPRLRPQRIEPVVAGAIEAALSAQGASPEQIRLHLDAPLPAVILDEHLLRQALINLLINGLQATVDGAGLAVHVRPEPSPQPRWVDVEVADRGPGIPADVAGQIFQPFFTTKAKGTGLGLAIVKRVAEAHRGEIRFIPRSGGGTVFSLRLPAHDPDLDPPSAARPSRPVSP